MTPLERFDLKWTPEPMSGCWLWTGAMLRDGPDVYGRFALDGHRGMLAHRASALLTGVSIPPSDVVMHLCNNRACVNPAHLCVGTQKQNMEQAARENRMSRTHQKHQDNTNRLRGERHHKAKIEADDVAQIRRLGIAGQLSKLMIANAFGIAPCHVSKIILRQVWKHVA